MALESSNRSWRLAFSDGAKRRQVSVPAADLAALACAVAKAKERFGMPASARVVSCYEAVSEARSSITRYIAFYNCRRPHRAHKGGTPDAAYFSNQAMKAAA